MKKVIILDGPPASGKTTLAILLNNKLKGYVVTYKNLGLINMLITLLLFIYYYKDYKRIKARLADRLDPILLVNKSMTNKLGYIFFLLEIIYKVIQMLKIVILLILVNILIFDEFIVLRWTNYIYLRRKGILKTYHVNYFARLDISFIRILTILAKIKYLYINRSLPTLIANWKKRGHYINYNYVFMAINNVIARSLNSLFRHYNLNINVENLTKG